MFLKQELQNYESVELLSYGDTGYDEARQVYNRMHDLKPLLIVRTQNSIAIRKVLKLVTKHKLELAIRGGGHHIAGFGSTDGGILLDFSGFNGVQIDSLQGIARIEPGARLRDVDMALCPRGYVIPTGTVSDTGIAGLTLGGGIGWLVGSLGFTCDNLIGADVMLATGEIIRAEEPQHRDLLWALRGGGGNFGVVLEFRYRLSSLPNVYCGYISVHHKEVPRVLIQLVEYMDKYCPANLVLAPVFTINENSRQFSLSIDFCLCNYQDISIIETLENILGLAGTHQYVTNDFRIWQTWFDRKFQPPMRGYWKSICTDDLNKDTINMLLTAAASMPSTQCSITIEHLNKNRRTVNSEYSFFPIKSKNYGVLFSARWSDKKNDQSFVNWVKKSALVLENKNENSSYSNYSLFDTQSRMVLLDNDYERLLNIKERYDEDNLFNRNHNICKDLIENSSV